MILSLFIVWAAILLFALSNSIWMLCIARLLQGFASCGVFVLGLAYVADVYDDDQSNLGVVMSFIFSGLALGQLVGPPVGGALFDAGKYYPFVFTALLVAVDFIGRLLIIDKPKHAPAESVPVHQADLDSTAIELIVATDRSPTESVPKSTVVVEQNPSEFSIRSLFKMRELLVLCGLCLILAVVLTQLEPTVPLYINALYGYNSAQIGALFLAFVLPNITGGMLGGWMFDKYGMRLVSIIGLPASFISLILLGLPQPVHIAWTIFAVILFGFSNGFAFAPVPPGIAASVPKTYYTMGYVLMNLVYSMGISVGPVVGSLIYSSGGWMWQQFAFAFVSILSFPLILYMPKNLKQ
ncbi:hypothetical protein HDU84_004246 [Entophlyctis sp. JEL0112]|nr:hypothetical protein HDU84_004246 [Entophlyctis sp. JEL0112]